MTTNYFNFTGTAVDENDVAAQIKTEFNRVKSTPVDDSSLDKHTVRTVARIVDSAFSEFLDDVAYRLDVGLDRNIDLNLSHFEDLYEKICDTVENEVRLSIVEDEEDEDEELAPYIYSSYDPEWDEDEEDFVDSEDYDFENPRY